MFKSLRKKFIATAVGSVAVVIAILAIALNFINFNKLEERIDTTLLDASRSQALIKIFAEDGDDLVITKNSSSATEYNGFSVAKVDNNGRIIKAYRDELRKSDHKNLEAIKTAIAKFNANDELFLGGTNMIADDMIGFIKSDLLIYGLSVLALLSFSLWLFFRQIRWIILPMFICAVSAIFTTGIFGMFGWEVTVISSNYIALQLIITISTVIHLVVSYREFYAKHPKYSQNQLIYLTLRDKFSPSFWAIFTTVIGFSSLMSADIKPVIMLGIMMSAGISVSLVLAFLLFGAINVNLKKLAPVRTFENSFKAQATDDMFDDAKLKAAYNKFDGEVAEELPFFPLSWDTSLSFFNKRVKAYDLDKVKKNQFKLYELELTANEGAK